MEPGMVPFEKQRLTDSETSSDFDEGSEEEEEALWVSWSLPVEESVYSEALLAPLIEAEIQKGAQMPRKRRQHWNTGIRLSPLLTLFLNAVVQSVVTWKVRDLTNSKVEDTSHRLFGILCKKEANLAFNSLLEPLEPGEFYWNCAPLTPTLLGNGDLDLNHDGGWSFQEARKAHDDAKVKYRPKRNTLVTTWYYMKEIFERGEHVSSGRLEERRARSNNFTVIPLQDISAELQRLRLCAAADPNLCGNLEVRGILDSIIPGSPNVQTRIKECKSVMDRCSEAFGQEYEVYLDWVEDFCGAPQKKWNRQHKTISTLYSKPDSFAHRQDAITKPPYWGFLIVILLIWWMSMLEELRCVLAWWIVLIWFPVQPPRGVESIEISGDKKVQVNSITLGYKLIMIVVNLLPRTMIAAVLPWLGSHFLLVADQYEDLILNSVALGFLIEVDNMLYKASASQEVKEWMDSCEPLVVKRRSCGWFAKCRRKLPLRVTVTCTLVALAIGLVWYSYNSEEGKYKMGMALQCLCQAEGQYCATSQFLGGYSSVELANRLRGGSARPLHS